MSSRKSYIVIVFGEICERCNFLALVRENISVTVRVSIDGTLEIISWDVRGM